MDFEIDRLIGQKNVYRWFVIWWGMAVARFSTNQCEISQSFKTSKIYLSILNEKRS